MPRARWIHPGDLPTATEYVRVLGDSISVGHTGRYGQLAGKAVAVEPGSPLRAIGSAGPEHPANNCQARTLISSGEAAQNDPRRMRR